MPVSFMVSIRIADINPHGSATFLPDPHLKLMDMDPDLNGIL